MFAIFRLNGIGISVTTLACAVAWVGLSIQPNRAAGQGVERWLSDAPTASDRSTTDQWIVPQTDPASRTTILTVQDPADDQEPPLRDVPVAPLTDDARQVIGPPLGVRSTALRGRDIWSGERAPFCNLGPEICLFPRGPRGTELGGWVQVGYHDENTRLFNSRRDEANLHQAWAFLENRADRHGPGLDFGFRIDGLYGIDAQKVQAFGNSPAGDPSGWDNAWDHGSYGFALPQAYGEIAGRGGSVIIGKFFSPFGYERVAAPDNFFYSRTYGRFFTQPFTHTGVLATVEGRRGIEWVGGFTLGWETGFDQLGGGSNFIGGLRYRLSHQDAISYFVSIGDTGILGDDGLLASAVYERQISRQLRYVLQSDFLDVETVKEFNFANYLLYGVNECLSLGTRLEWYRTDRFSPGMNSTWSWTNGLNYRPHANVVVRPEARLDWGEGSLNGRSTTIIGIDAIVTF